MSTNSVNAITNIYGPYQGGPEIYPVEPQSLTNAAQKEVLKYSVSTKSQGFPGQWAVQAEKTTYNEDLTTAIGYRLFSLNLENGKYGGVVSNPSMWWSEIGWSPLDPAFPVHVAGMPGVISQGDKRYYDENLGGQYQIVKSFNDTNTPVFLYHVIQLIDPTYVPPLPPAPPATNGTPVPRERISPFLLSLPAVNGCSVTDLTAVATKTIGNNPSEKMQFSINTTLLPGNNSQNLHGSRGTLEEGHWNISVCRRGVVFYGTNDINKLIALNLEDGQLQVYRNCCGGNMADGEVIDEYVSVNRTVWLKVMLKYLGFFTNNNAVIASNVIQGLIQKDTLTQLPVLKIEKIPGSPNSFKLIVTDTVPRADYLLEMIDWGVVEFMQKYYGSNSFYFEHYYDYASGTFLTADWVRSDGAPLSYTVTNYFPYISTNNIVTNQPMNLFRINAENSLVSPGYGYLWDY